MSLHCEDGGSTGGSGDDARNLLSTLVASIITMSSVVFSITVVALSLAANQFGSRLIRTHLTTFEPSWRSACLQ